MELKNYQYLSESLTKLGFGEVFNDGLKTKMELGMPEFYLKATAKFGKDEMLYIPKFEKKEGEYYFLNNYKATLMKEGKVTDMQDFLLYKQRGFSAKEAYNLLDGRSVYKVYMKDTEKVGRWSRLDLNSMDDKGNHIIRSTYDNASDFRLVRELSKLPIIHASQDEKELLIRSLQTGDRVSIIVNQAGQKEKMFVEATPHLGQLTLYNGQMEKVNLSKNQMTVVADEKVHNNLTDTTKKLIEKSQNVGQQENQQMKRKAS